MNVFRELTDSISLLKSISKITASAATSSNRTDIC